MDGFEWIIIAFAIVSWIGGQFFRIFVKRPEQKDLPRRPLAPPGGPAAGGGPRPGGLAREVEDFLRHLREGAPPARAEPERPRPFLGDAEELEWEDVDLEPPPGRPPRAQPTPTFVLPEEVPLSVAPPKRLALPRASRAAISSEGNITDSDPTVSGNYCPLARMELPGWLTLSDITEPRGIRSLLGLSPRDAMLAREVLGPPKAYRGRRGPDWR
jgi:hypothetical protein